mmetsp:Transcript_33685/g.105028  ORF Transcript_33685/g.105028 Transcript_33685/m.105028 type:complete len:114 (+) Transcript_33685:80-421(+)
MGLKYAAAYLLSALGGKDSPAVEDIQKILESVECDFDEAIAVKLVTEMEGKSVHEVIASGRDKLKGFGGGGGGAVVGAVAGGGVAEDKPKEEKKEEKVEEEEEEEEIEFDLFG